MKYRIQNNRTGDWWEGEATGAKDACKEAGWPPSVCWVRQQSDKGSGGWKTPTDWPDLGKATRKFQGKLVTTVQPGEPVEEHVPTPAAMETVAEQAEAVEVAEVVQKIVDMPEPEKTAWHNRLHIMQLARDAQVMFLTMGELLYNARENAEWSHLHYESFEEYIQDLGLPMTNSYSWATRLIGIHEFLVMRMGISKELLLQIGVAKLSRLLPAARQGKLDEELLNKATVLSDLDLRIELGHHVGEGGGSTESIICPRCGAEIQGARWVSGINAEPIKQTR